MKGRRDPLVAELEALSKRRRRPRCERRMEQLALPFGTESGPVFPTSGEIAKSWCAAVVPNERDTPGAKQTGGVASSSKQPAKQTGEQTRKQKPPEFAPQPPPEFAALAAELDRLEWAADGGDGSVCSTGELEQVSTLDLEWMLHGALLEVMAVIVLRADEARSLDRIESEDSPEVAE